MRIGDRSAGWKHPEIRVLNPVGVVPDRMAFLESLKQAPRVIDPEEIVDRRPAQIRIDDTNRSRHSPGQAARQARHGPAAAGLTVGGYEDYRMPASLLREKNILDNSGFFFRCELVQLNRRHDAAASPGVLFSLPMSGMDPRTATSRHVATSIGVLNVRS